MLLATLLLATLLLQLTMGPVMGAAEPAPAAQGVRLYVMGGSDPRKPPQGRVAVFTPPDHQARNGSWQPVQAMGAVREGGRGAALGGYLYHVGGSSLADYPYLNSTLRYSPSAGGKWEKVADLACEPAHPVFCPDALGDDPGGGGLADHAVVSLGGSIFAIGGTNGTTSLSTVVKYDPSKDSWTFVAPMSIGRCYVAAATLDGKIYAIGGSATPAGPCSKPSVCPEGSGPGALASVEVYDPQTDRWSSRVQPTNIARSTHAAATAGGMIYVLGGEDGGSTAVEFDSVERYDPSRDSWTMVAPMTLPRAQAVAGVINGIIFAVGGYNSLTDFGWTSTVETYDSAHDSWSFVAPIPLQREYLTAAVL
jgi:hypothetical protein